MFSETVELYDGDPRVTLTAYIHTDAPELRIAPRPALIVFPGGGLEYLSEREAEPVAVSFFGIGMNTFVLRYSIGEFGHFPLPLLDASLAVTYIRRHADEYHIDPHRVFAAGFSAGGYIAAMLGVRWQEPFIEEELDIEFGENKPDGLILAYPVITAMEFAHRGTINISIGEDAKEDELEAHSLELLVTEDTPPAFIWHTSDDRSVPVENSLIFAAALSSYGIPFELHVYPKGPHGLSLATRETSCGSRALEDARVAEWTRLAASFIESLGS